MTRRHLLKYFVLMILPAIAMGCAVGPTHQSLKNANLPELIPAHTFFQSSDGYWRFKVSPDGSMVAFRWRSKGLPVIGIKKTGSDRYHIVRTLYDRDVNQLDWMPNSRQIIFTQKTDTKTRHLFIADIDGPFPSPIDLTPDATGKREIVHIGKTQPGTVWITDYHQPPPVKLERLEVNKKEVKAIQEVSWISDCHYQSPIKYEQLDVDKKEVESNQEEPKKIIQWILDDRDQLRACIAQTQDLDYHLDIFHPEVKTWDRLIEWKFDEDIEFLGFGPKNKTLWLLSNRNRETMSLVNLDIETGKENLVYQDPQADIIDVTLSRKNRKPLVAYSFPNYPKAHFLDATYKKILTPFMPAERQGLFINGMDEKENIIGFTVYTEKIKDAYLYHLPTDTIEFWGDSVMALQASLLADMRPITFQSRDGLNLKGYLTIPKGVKPENLPTVLLVHGGPWSRDYWEYDRLVQFLANRGYAVLQINYRGSTGYGKSFMQKARGEFAGKMHDDLVDGIQWAIDRGYTDPAHIAIMGWSYGGYATLVGLTFTPYLFKCGIAIAGPSDLTTLITDKKAHMTPDGTLTWHKYVGDPGDESDRQIMKAKSPLTHIDKITKPLLIMHGGEDTIVAATESDQMVEAMRKAGKEVDYVFFPDEGHGFEKWESWSLLFRKVETFLAAHLGGRSETRLSEIHKAERMADNYNGTFNR